MSFANNAKYRSNLRKFAEEKNAFAEKTKPRRSAVCVWPVLCQPAVWFA